jgi:hypothetical protein
VAATAVAATAVAAMAAAATAAAAMAVVATAAAATAAAASSRNILAACTVDAVAGPAAAGGEVEAMYLKTLPKNLT